MDSEGRAGFQKTKPIAVPDEEHALVAIQRAADFFEQQVAALLKPGGLSPTQYNVLRILRGAGPDGLPCGEVAGRMINRDPDITRLLDRMESRGLVARVREKADRRVITARITPDGLLLVAQFDEPVAALAVRQFEALSKAELRLLLDLVGRLCPPK